MDEIKQKNQELQKVLDLKRPYYMGLLEELKMKLSPGSVFFQTNPITREEVNLLCQKVGEMREVQRFYQESAFLSQNLMFYENKINQLQETVSYREAEQKMQEIMKQVDVDTFTKRVQEKYPKIKVWEEGDSIFSDVNPLAIDLFKHAILNFHDPDFNIRIAREWILRVMDSNRDLDAYERPSQVVDDFLQLQELGASFCLLRKS